MVAASRISRSWLTGAAAALLSVGWLAFYGAVGYDVGLTMLVVSASIVAIAQAQSRPTRLSIAFVLLTWVLLPLARIDALLILLLEAWVLWRGTGRVRLVAVLVVTSIMPAAFYYGYSQWTLGTYSVSNATRTIDHLSAAAHLGPIAWSPVAVVYLAGLAVPAGVAIAGIATDRSRLVVAAGIGVIAYAALLIVYPVTYDVPRYFLLVMPLLVVAVASGLRSIHPRPMGLAITLLVAVVMALSAMDPLAQATVEAGRGLTFTRITEAKVVQQVNLVAAPQAAVLGYEVQDRFEMRSDLRFIAVNGLTDGLINPYRASGNLTGFLLRYRPELWIMNDAPGGRIYTANSVLDLARTKLLSGAASTTIDGITFVVVMRQGPSTDGFASCLALVRLEYSAS